MKESTKSPRSNADEIARVAYQLWEQQGRPAGKDLEFWLRAEQQLGASRQAQPSNAAQSLRAEKSAGVAQKKQWKPGCNPTRSGDE